MAVYTLKMAQAMRRPGVFQEQEDSIAEQIGRSFRSDDLATRELPRAEIAELSSDLSRRLAGMLLVHGGLAVMLTKLL